MRLVSTGDRRLGSAWGDFKGHRLRNHEHVKVEKIPVELALLWLQRNVAQVGVNSSVSRDHHPQLLCSGSSED